MLYKSYLAFMHDCPLKCTPCAIRGAGLMDNPLAGCYGFEVLPQTRSITGYVGGIFL